MREVVMQTVEPDSTIEATEIIVNILDSTRQALIRYPITQHHLNTDKVTQLLRRLEYFKDLFDGTLGDWDTVPVNLELKPGSKPFNSKYYPVPRINKDTFCKDLKR